MNAQNTALNSTLSARLTALDNLAVPTLLFACDGSVRYANKAAQQLLALPDTPETTTGTATVSPSDLLSRLDHQHQQILRNACASLAEERLTLTLLSGSQARSVQLHLHPIGYPETASDNLTSANTQVTPEPLLQATLRDISHYQASEHLPVHFQQAMQQTEDMVMVTDCHGSIEYVNPAFVSQTGYSAAEVLGKNPRLLSSDAHDADFYSQMWQTLRAGHSYRSIFINCRRNGERYHEEKTITPIRDHSGLITHFVATGRDITDLVNSEQRLDYLRRFDPLTGLPNRQRLSEQFDLHLLQRRKTPMALFLVDLDRLSRINDSLGRPAGDDVLRTTANRLRQALPSHLVGRLGSDAFIVMAEEIATPDQAAQLGQKIRQIMALPFELSQQELFMSVSLGITLYPYDGDQFDVLVNKADSAMHRCKENDQGFSFFTDDLTLQTQQRVHLENQLRQALLRKEFHLVFQPRIDLKTGQIDSVEALLRWTRADGSQVSPAEFIPILEEIGLITSVGEWVLMRACAHASRWQKQGQPMRISVNLSARQLQQSNLQEIVRRALSLSGLTAPWLELELTETSMLEDVEHSIRQLSLLRAEGIRVAIDDFGTGYSSLAYLKKLPADTLKIDRAFIQELESRDQTDLNIVHTIIQLAHNLNLSVTAEGIETPHQLSLLKELGCNEAQGFLLAKPMQEEVLLQFKQNFELKQHLPITHLR